MSDLYQSLSHSKWDCKYHVVFVPKQRRKAIEAGFRHVRVQVDIPGVATYGTRPNLPEPTHEVLSGPTAPGISTTMHRTATSTPRWKPTRRCVRSVTATMSPS